jgi:hypothetical protein
MIASDHEHWCQLVHKIESVNHLLTVPQLALERWVQKITTVQDPHLATLALQLSNQSDYATEAPGTATFDCAHTIRVIQMDECNIT